MHALYYTYGILATSVNLQNLPDSVGIYTTSNYTIICIKDKCLRISELYPLIGLSEVILESIKLTGFEQQILQSIVSGPISLYMIPYTPLKICTFNLGYSVQTNELRGSEKEFVRLCQTTYPQYQGLVSPNILPNYPKMSMCTYNAVDFIIKNSFDIVGLQEFVNKYVQEFLGALNTLTTKNYKLLGNKAVKILYNADIIGDGLEIDNVMYEEGRRIQVVWFERIKLLVLNAHAPHVRDISQVTQNLLNTLNLSQVIVPDRILALGDFNDGKGELRELRILNKICKNHKSLEKSCCFDNGFILPGDYILDSNDMPSIYQRIVPEVPMSDHYPVVKLD